MQRRPLGGGRYQQIEVTLWKAASQLLFHTLEPTMAADASAVIWTSTSLSTQGSKLY